MSGLEFKLVTQSRTTYRVQTRGKILARTDRILIQFVADQKQLVMSYTMWLWIRSVWMSTYIILLVRHLPLFCTHQSWILSCQKFCPVVHKWLLNNLHTWPHCMTVVNYWQDKHLTKQYVLGLDHTIQRNINSIFGIEANNPTSIDFCVNNLLSWQ